MAHLFVLPDNLAPYQISRLNAISLGGVQIEVVTVQTKQHHRPWADDIALSFHVYQARQGQEAATINERILSGIYQSITFSGYGQPFRSLFTSCETQPGLKKGIFVDSVESRKASFVKEHYKRWLLPRHLDYFIVPGPRQANYIRNLLGSVEVVLTPYVPYERPSLDNAMQERGDYFLCVSRLSPEKNLLTLLRAYKLYRDAGGTKLLKIVGDGPSRSTLVREALELGLEQHVELAGWLSQEEIKQFLRKAFAFVLPSTYEPFGVVIAEAVQYGVPVVVSDRCGAIDSVAFNFRNALIFNPSSVHDLAGKLSVIDVDRELFFALKTGAEAFSASTDLHTAVAPLIHFFRSLERSREPLPSSTVKGQI